MIVLEEHFECQGPPHFLWQVQARAHALVIHARLRGQLDSGDPAQAQNATVLLRAVLPGDMWMGVGLSMDGVDTVCSPWINTGACSMPHRVHS